MFNLPVDSRLAQWTQLRRDLETSSDPFQQVWDFWKDAPFTPFNHEIDHHNHLSWPTPWEIIVSNKYDDFTKALMIAFSLKLTARFNNSTIGIYTCCDTQKNRLYYLVVVDSDIVINFNDDTPTTLNELPESLYIETTVSVVWDK